MNKEKNAIFRCSGYSMYPVLKPDDILVLDKDCSSIKIGDIYSYCIYKKVFTHRVVEITSKYVAFKGDTHLQIKKICRDQIIGKVIRIIRQEQDMFYPIKKNILSNLYTYLFPAYFSLKNYFHKKSV